MSGGRIRTLKPEWLDDERLASASDTARLLSVSLILLADDHGRGRAHPLFLASRVWPYSSRDPRDTLASLDSGLNELCAMGFLRLYSVGGQDYFEVRNWTKHQRVDKPSRPRVPLPIESGSGDPRETIAPDQGSGIRDQGSPTGDQDRSREPPEDVSFDARIWAEWSAANRRESMGAIQHDEIRKLRPALPSDDAQALTAFRRAADRFIAQQKSRSKPAYFNWLVRDIGTLLADAETPSADPVTPPYHERYVPLSKRNGARQRGTERDPDAAAQSVTDPKRGRPS